MKRQNGVFLSGKLKDLRVQEVQVGKQTNCVVTAVLVTDHEGYGGHHQVLFTEELLAEVQAFARLTNGDLEVAVEGWLRSKPGQPSTVVVSRAIFMNVTQAQRDLVARLKADAKPTPFEKLGPVTRGGERADRS